MWVLRILSGRHQGHSVKLKLGKNTLGRTANNDIHLPDSGISKNHALMEVTDLHVILLDLNSSNGTFVNGVQVRKTTLNSGDKISLDETLLELVDLPQYIDPIHSQHVSESYPVLQEHAHNASNDFHHGAEVNSTSPDEDKKKVTVSQGFNGIMQIAQNYLETVVLPGIYKLPEWLEFKWVLGLFLSIFVLTVTILSTIPLIQILKDSVEIESQRRALTIARSLATVNRDALSHGLESATSIDIARREPGVSKAYIISNKDGTIIAPSDQSGSYLKIDYVHTARRSGKEEFKQISDDKIIALSPIEFYQPELGTRMASAYAVIEYDMASISIDNSQTIRLFIQTLFISLVVGSILYFFLYKLIEYPISSLNSQLDKALKGETQNEIQSKYIFPSLDHLISNVNSALTRVNLSPDSQNLVANYDRTFELNNVVQLIGFPAIAITTHDHIIASSNPSFSDKTGIDSSNLLRQPISQLTDQALRLNIIDLLEKSIVSPDQMITGEIEFGGYPHEIIAQSIFGSDSVAYTLIIIVPLEEEAVA